MDSLSGGDFTLASLGDYSVDAGPDQAITAGASANLSATVTLAVPPYTCTWSDGASVVSTDCDVALSPVVTTTYLLTVTDDFGRVSSDSVTVSVN